MEEKWDGHKDEIKEEKISPIINQKNLDEEKEISSEEDHDEKSPSKKTSKESFLFKIKNSEETLIKTSNDEVLDEDDKGTLESIVLKLMAILSFSNIFIFIFCLCACNPILTITQERKFLKVHSGIKMFVFPIQRLIKF